MAKKPVMKDAKADASKAKLAPFGKFKPGGKMAVATRPDVKGGAMSKLLKKYGSK